MQEIEKLEQKIDDHAEGSSAPVPDLDPEIAKFRALAIPDPDYLARGDNEIKIPPKLKSRKPGPTELVYTHGDPLYNQVYCVLGKHHKKEYVGLLLTPEILGRLSSNLGRFQRISLAITIDGDIFLWPSPCVKDRVEDPNPWLDTHDRAKQKSQNNWVRMASARERDCYDVIVYKNKGDKPKWPTKLKPMEEYVAEAYEGRLVDNVNHPSIADVVGP